MTIIKLIEQKCKRFVSEILPKVLKHEDIIENNEFFIKRATESFKESCSSKQTIKLNNKWAKDYKKMGYTFMSREDIYKEVCKILSLSR